MLPTLNGSLWLVPGDNDWGVWADRSGQLGLRVNAPALPEKDRETWNGVAASEAGNALSAHQQESFFTLISRTALGCLWVIAGLIGLRIPGEARSFDAIFLALGLGFLGYTLFRHGSTWLRWGARKAEVWTALQSAQWKEHRLLDTLAQALARRKALPPDQRGRNPDEELLDEGAYRKLIENGTTTREELKALKLAILSRWGFGSELPADYKITEISKTSGMDIDTAVFYLDLVKAVGRL
jgi:hypothetical protein